MKFKKVKLNYMDAVLHTEPVDKITVSASDLEELSMSIVKKCEENAKNYSLGISEIKSHDIPVRENKSISKVKTLHR